MIAGSEIILVRLEDLCLTNWTTRVHQEGHVYEPGEFELRLSPDLDRWGRERGTLAVPITEALHRHLVTLRRAPEISIWGVSIENGRPHALQAGTAVETAEIRAGQAKFAIVVWNIPAEPAEGVAHADR